MAMHRDTDFTFEDILDGANLSETVRQYSAIVSQPDTSATLKSLRFIQIPSNFEEVDANGSDLVFEIIGSDAYPEGTDYIAVSYCWNSFTQQGEANRNVSIVDRGVTRKPRCPDQVLLRAARFAAHTPILLMWIDQECIDQTDHEDVQRHLQCMHQIFAMARPCIGLLNFEIANWRQASALNALSAIKLYSYEVWAGIEKRPDILLNVDGIDFITRLLKSIRRDPWISRTWVFQERSSGYSTMRLLFSISPNLLELLREEDLELHHSLAHIRLFDLTHSPARWLLNVRKFDLETPSLHAALNNLHDVAMKSNPFLKEITVDSTIDFIAANGDLDVRDHPLEGYESGAIFGSIEACDNQIVSDRVAIFSNVCHLSHHLNTYGLSSYSISLLMLLSANKCLPQIVFRGYVEDNDPEYPLVHCPRMCDLHAWIVQLTEMISFESKETRKVHYLRDDLRAVSRALIKVNPESSRKGAGLDKFVKQINAKTPDRAPGPLKCTMVIPTSATIGDVVCGIMTVYSRKRELLSHDHGQQILEYAIATDQVPPDAEFVAFYGDYCWEAEFVERFFRVEDAESMDET